MRRFLSWLIGLPLAIIMIAFAVANRDVVKVSLDPLTREDPWFAIDMPLWILFFAGIFVGLIVGWLSAWFSQSKWRKASRKAQSDLGVARMENERLKKQGASTGTGLVRVEN